MSFLSADAILQAKDLKVKEVEVLEWGGTVGIKCFSGADREALALANQKAEEKYGKEGAERKFALIQLAHFLCDADGNRLFESFEKLEQLNEKNASVLERLFFIGMELNGYAPQAVEQAEKNSESGQSSDSGST